MKWTPLRIVIASVAATLLVVVSIGVVVAPDASPPQPAPAPQLPTREQTGGIDPELAVEIEMRARGAMLFVFFHELGHMLIAELGIPATGPEEDVVDEFAAFLLTDQIKAAPEEQKAVLTHIVMSGAIYWRIAAKMKEEQGLETPWYDEHSPSERRYAAILCLATGADPLRFIPLAVKTGMPERRLAQCAQEYDRKHAAWEQLMASHRPGMWDAIFGSGRLTLEYGPVMKNEWLVFQEAYRQGGNFEQMLHDVSAMFALPRDVPVAVKGCGFINAYWSIREKQIVLCHDMFEYVLKTFAQDMLAQTQEQGGQAGDQGGQGPAPAPGPAPQGGGQGTGQAAALAGVWNCQSFDGATGAQVNEQLVLQPDSNFRSMSQNALTGFTLNVWGRWSFANGSLRYDLAGYEPKQFCGPLGCSPVTLGSPMFFPVQMPQPGFMQLPGGSCRKTG